MGDSDGEVRTFEDVGVDIRAALDAFCAEAAGVERIVLWGLCDAASSILLDGQSCPRVCGLVLVNPWVRTAAGEAQAYVSHYYLGRLLQGAFWRKMFSGQLNVWGAVRDFAATVWRARRAAGAGRPDVASSFIARMCEGAASYRGPILILLSGRDLTAREFEQLHGSSAEWRAALAGNRVTWIRLAETDHTFSDRAALERASQESVRWLRQLPGVAT
jgi:exosortase A-associated hydrolase 1